MNFFRVYFLALLLIFTTTMGFAQKGLSFYLGGDTAAVRQDMPYPGHFSGHRFGWWHFSHDQLSRYMAGLAERSPRVDIQEYGRTHENRPLQMLTITSRENHQRLRQIRQAHQDYIHGRSNAYVKQDMPLIVWLGYSVHGNEASPAHAAMLTAYYLAASHSAEVQHLLDSLVILVDPVLNPDGFNRAAQWSNMHMHRVQTGDRRDRQFREAWPGGRTNHYWFDLNRDWMPAQHPESKARLKLFHAWKPHVVTDHHEMGSNSTFFFQPGEPQRVNPRTPERNFTLTKKLSHHHARALDEIGSLYFSEEGFDDFYYGKGSTYPDGQGSIGILFEQSRVMGQVLENDQGRQTFAESIRNHFTVSLSTMEGAMAHRADLNTYQREFFEEASAKYQQDPVKAYLFRARHDPTRLRHFLELLDLHQIQVHHLASDHTVDNQDFPRQSSYMVSLDQPQYRFIKSLFEKRTRFEDSIFYDVSAWTMPLAFNLTYKAVDQQKVANQLKGKMVNKTASAEGKLVGGKSPVGYMVRSNPYNLYSAMHQLQEKGLILKTAEKSLTAKTPQGQVAFPPGSVFISSRQQKSQPAKVFQIVRDVADQSGIDIYSLETALTPRGLDLGSWSMAGLEQPHILMVTGEGTSSYSSGEIWHLLDHRFQIPVVMVRPEALKQINLFDFNTLILPDGNYEWGKTTQKKLTSWVEEGNLMVALERANQWLMDQGMSDLEQKEISRLDSTRTLPYNKRRNALQAQAINGVILRASVDPTHPVGYGMGEQKMPVFKDNEAIYQNTPQPYDTPVMIQQNPLMSGYLSEENQKLLGNSPYCHITELGGGNIISFTANPNFRAFWYGTNKLFMNALFFGRLIE